MIADCITQSDPDPLCMFQRGKLRASVIMTRIVLLSLVAQAPAIKGQPHQKHRSVLWRKKI